MELQYRVPPGEFEIESVNFNGEIVDSLSAIQCPPGWDWEDEWSTDFSRACDEDGGVYKYVYITVL